MILMANSIRELVGCLLDGFRALLLELSKFRVNSIQESSRKDNLVTVGQRNWKGYGEYWGIVEIKSSVFRGQNSFLFWFRRERHPTTN